MWKKKTITLSFLILLSFSGCTQVSKEECVMPQLKVVKVKHTAKLKFKRAKHNYIVPIKQQDLLIKEYIQTSKALNFMNAQAKMWNNKRNGNQKDTTQDR